MTLLQGRQLYKTSTNISLCLSEFLVLTGLDVSQNRRAFSEENMSDAGML